MPRIVISHEVEDVDRWLGYKDERADTIEQYGSDVTDYVASDGSNYVAITADVDDVAEFDALLAAPPPELGEVMERHGVIQPATLYVER